jgi:predicted CXXCH cytochrome family protein
MVARKVAFVSVAFVAALAAFLVLDGTGGARHASADGGPHGGYTATGGTQGGLPDQCAACHRVHQGQSVGRLLKASSPYALCLTCHNGSGSVLDVLDGVRLGALIGPTTGAIRQAEQGSVTASLAPVAEVSVPVAPTGATSNAEFTLVVNRAVSAGLTITFGTPVVKDDAGVVLPSATRVPFGAAYFCQIGSPCSTATTSLTPLAGTGVSYYEVFVPGLPAAVGGDNVVLPVLVDGGAGSAPQVVLSARIRKVSDYVTAVGGNAILNGGGFNFVDGKNVTSRHNADPADNSLNPWGYAGQPSVNANTNTGQNPISLASPLQCTSCHNPHGTENYRILKEGVNGTQVNVKAFVGGVFVKNEGARGLEAGYTPDKYVQEFYGSSGEGGTGNAASTGGGIATLCGACHTAYPSTGASVPFTGGSPNVTHYRHKTEMFYRDWDNPDTARLSQNPEESPVAGFPALRLASNASVDNGIVSCLTCHRVHGTATVMDGYALKPSTALLTPGADVGLADEDLTPSQGTDHTGRLSLSTLLFTNNRGMCQACHQWGVTTPSGPD